MSAIKKNLNTGLSKLVSDLVPLSRYRFNVLLLSDLKVGNASPQVMCCSPYGQDGLLHKKHQEISMKSCMPASSLHNFYQHSNEACSYTNSQDTADLVPSTFILFSVEQSLMLMPSKVTSLLLSVDLQYNGVFQKQWKNAT